VSAAFEAQLAHLPRARIAGASWRDYGAIILAPNLAAAAPLVDRLAPEHLEIIARDADALSRAIANAGAIFIGPFTPEAIGDYVGGCNHVLPTSRSARFSSGLGVLDFLKRTSILKCDAKSLAALGRSAVVLAEAEGLQAHARSVAMRLSRERVG
jgi:histidinol dehydrogenase